ncbi:MAG: hypothetical protein KF847_17710 [Pirellulales bacterium]|nr:hypothetical protein [Pirellulales bacterium]
MNAKVILRTALLAFVVAAIAVTIRREYAASDGADAASDAAVATLPDEGLVVAYFHGNVRCPTCQTIERYAREAVESQLAAELADGQVAWRMLNYETASNARFASEYEIVAPTVVLVQRHEGRDGPWRNLGRVWELAGDKPAFIEYVAAEAREFLAAK